MGPASALAARGGTRGAWGGRMTIQGPPNEEMPPTVPDEQPRDAPTDEPEQRAPGVDHPPMGAPRDEPDPEGA